MRIPGGGSAVTVEGIARGVPGAAHTDASGTLRVEVDRPRGRRARGDEIRALEREYRAVVEEILDLRGADARIRAFLRSITEPGRAGRHLRLLARPQPARTRSGCSRRST